MTAHVDDDVVVVVDELGLDGDDAESQAVVNATIPANPLNASRASRLFNFTRSLDFIAHPFKADVPTAIGLVQLNENGVAKAWRPIEKSLARDFSTSSPQFLRLIQVKESMEQVMKVMTVLLAGLGALALVGGLAASLAPATAENRSRVMLMASQQMSQNLKSSPNPTPAQSIRLVLGGHQNATHH